MNNFAISHQKVNKIIDFIENEKVSKTINLRSSVYKFKAKYDDGT